MKKYLEGSKGSNKIVELGEKMKKQLVILGIVVLLLTIGLSGCLDSYVEGTGRIQYNDFEGGFYGIVSDDGEDYDPINLPDDFKEDGLLVSFKLVVLENQVSYHMWGEVVRIINIEKL